MLIAAVIFAAVIVWYKLPTKPSADLVTPAVVTFDTGKVNRVRISQPGKPEVILGKENGAWKLMQPYAANADSGSVSSMLSTLSAVAPTEKLGAQSDLGPFGLKTPSVVQVSLEGGKSYTFDFGSDSPTGGNSYAQVEPSKDVLVIATYVKNDALKSAFDLQEKSVLKFSPDKVNKLSAQVKGKKLAFERKDGKWPEANQSAIQTLLDALQNAQMNSMVDASGLDVAKDGLNHPAYVVSLTTADGARTLEVGNKTGNDYYARTSMGPNAGPGIFTISDYVVNDITALTAKKEAPKATSSTAKKETPKKTAPKNK